MSSVKSLMEGIAYTVREEGLRNVGPKIRTVVAEKFSQICTPAIKFDNSLFDVIYINGCDYSVPHPIRYRVDHQAEQLRAAGLSVGVVDAWNLDNDLLRHGRCFVVFRCPISDAIRDFILQAKALNKKVIYDIDDLVIDTKFTDQIPFVASMSKEEKEVYDNGVRRMGETLALCDFATTTTEQLAEVLKDYVAEVFINRNCASEIMFAYSEKAVYRRDVLPYLSEAQVERGDRKAYRLAKSRLIEKERTGEIVIGYFSGSITHNSDFQLVLPSIVRVMDLYPQVTLLLMGEIDLPVELAAYSNRIRLVPFSSWKRLPQIIASCDINIAPLEDTVFNRAKSENKWIEASLVKVPTIASCVGAFEDMIENGETGVLCSTAEEWDCALQTLIESPEERARIANNAYSYCKKHCTTINRARGISEFIKRIRSQNIVFVMPSLNTSGGVLVTFRHAAMLQDAGYDVTFLNTDNRTEWLCRLSHIFPVLNRSVENGKLDDCQLTAMIDIGVATLWDTLDFLRRYPRIKRKLYLVQNFETDFYLPGNPLRQAANSTYLDSDGIEYLTISKWCIDWLRDDYGICSKFVANGIDISQYTPHPRDYSDRKIRVLIEGDCNSEYKNVDESFRIVDALDSDKFEIWYMSYTGTTKKQYRIDKNLGHVSHDDVPSVYAQCDILLKSSILESFSYPPLEMMATGGAVVVCPNGGNAEYLIDGENCLLYERGNVDSAVEMIMSVVEDSALRDRLYAGGIATAASRDWQVLIDDVLSIYR